MQPNKEIGLSIYCRPQRKRSFGATNLTPFAVLRYANLWSDAFVERTRGSDGEPGILGLTYNSTSVSSLVSTLGVQLDTRIALANGRMFTPFLRVAWVHEFDPDRGVDSFLTQSPTVGYAFNGASAVSDAAQVFAGAKLDLTQTIGVYGFFEGEFADIFSADDRFDQLLKLQIKAVASPRNRLAF